VKDEMMNYEAKTANLEDESKFYISKDLSEVIKELEKITGVWGDNKEINDTYYTSDSLPKKATLRIRESGGEYTPTLKIPVEKNNKRIELETLESISQQLGVILKDLGDIEHYYNKVMTIAQKRFILNYRGVEFSADSVKYYDMSGKIFFETKIFEAELKDSEGRITRTGAIEELKRNNMLGKICKDNKYELGIKNLKN
jgi:hypothetical protein